MNAHLSFIECMRSRSSHRSLLLVTTALLLGVFFNPCTHGQTVVAKHQIQDGETVKGNIASVGDQQSWTFSAAKGDVVSIRIVSTTSGKSFIPEAKIYDPTGKKISPDKCFTSLELTITNTGTYSIICTDNEWGGGHDTGTYNLSIITVPVSRMTGPHSQ
jgi:hypothetical protein